ncbi:MAG TPA: hypothetical protein PLJ18_12215 [Niabella sp.]|nr:hypothetical protein [Niabella sp.]
MNAKNNEIVPTFAQISKLEMVGDIDKVTELLNQDPPKEWIKTNKYAGSSKYLSIDKIEYLLKTIIRRYKIEVTGQGTAFNGVWVTVRVHYVDMITGNWEFHDGIGSEAIQTKAGTSASDLINITQGAISIAFPKAKTAAIKDACHHFGRLFGSDLNRESPEDLYEVPEVISDEDMSDLFELKKDVIPAKFFPNAERIVTAKEKASYPKLHKYLMEL